MSPVRRLLARKRRAARVQQYNTWFSCATQSLPFSFCVCPQHYPQYGEMFSSMNNIINQANTVRRSVAALGWGPAVR